MVDVAIVRVDARTEANASVVLATGAYQATRTADEQGRAVFDGVPLVLGNNHVEVVATDRAGNVGLPAAVDVAYEVPAITPLTGTLQPAGAELAHGEPLVMHVVVVNPNAAAMAAQTLRIRVGDAASELASWEVVRDFVPHEVYETEVEFQSTGWPLGTLALVLELDASGTWVALDTRQLELIDRTPPSLALETPVAESVIRSPIVVSATASDALGEVVTVEARVDGGDWLGLSVAAGDTWISLPMHLADSVHHVELRANDAAGNVAAIGPVSFNTDTTSPLINISGVAEGDLVAYPVVPKIDITDSHLDASDVRLNGLPYTSGTPIAASGDYLLEASASDLAGNVSTSSVHFSVDLDVPDVVFLAPEPGSIVTDEAVDVVGQTEPRARVRLRNGSFEIDLDADVLGRFAVHAVPLEQGENTLAADAVDLAGNVGPVATLVVFREVVAEAGVAGDLGALPAPLPEGTWLDVHYRVHNIGGLALTGMPLRFELRPATGGAPVAADEFPLDLPLDAVQEGVHPLDTSSVPRGSYRLSMRAQLPGATGPVWVVLDIAPLGIDAVGCRHGDVIFADGFDGTGVRRDGVVFCDGFEQRSRIVTASNISTGGGQIAWLDLLTPGAPGDASFVTLSSTARANWPRTLRMSPRHALFALPVPSPPPPRVRNETAMLALGSTAPGKRSARTFIAKGWLGDLQ